VSAAAHAGKDAPGALGLEIAHFYFAWPGAHAQGRGDLLGLTRSGLILKVFLGDIGDIGAGWQGGVGRVGNCKGGPPVLYHDPSRAAPCGERPLREPGSRILASFAGSRAAICGVEAVLRPLAFIYQTIPSHKLHLLFGNNKNKPVLI
jgi:hypothetical protein